MEKESKDGLCEFLSALCAGVVGAALGTYVTDALGLNWLFLGLLVAIIFLIAYKAFLVLFEKFI